LSSGFGKRRHPILGYSKMHTGIDFAAPRGTPIFAAGDGVIDYAGRKGGYGKYIRIRHNSEFQAAYAHMRSYKKGMHKGKRVRQGDVIGYVGTTGRSTGPHLHYEIIRNGRKTNPLRVRMPSGKKLKGTALAHFMDVKTSYDQQYVQLTPVTSIGKLASAE
jgi:murein DD-endopeptidase MepM/ murein hydrolase activator NlpD